MKREGVLEMLERIFTRVEMCSDYIWRLPDHGVLTYGEYKALETVIQWLREFPEEPVSSDNKSKEERINTEPFNYFFAICHDIYNQIKEESPKPPAEDPATKFIRECYDAVITDQGKMNLIILEELKKRGIHVTEENAVAWSKRITIVDAGGFGKEYHNFYVYLNREWEFTIKRTCNASPDCSGYLQTYTYAYEVSDELPPEGTTL